MKDTARFLRVLSDESRLEMLWLLFNQREICVCDFTGALGITQSKASRHLATMRNAGLVVDRREGTWSFYSLKPQNDEIVQILLKALRRALGVHPRAEKLLHRLHECITCRVHSSTATTKVST